MNSQKNKLLLYSVVLVLFVASWVFYLRNQTTQNLFLGLALTVTLVLSIVYMAVNWEKEKEVNKLPVQKKDVEPKVLEKILPEKQPVLHQEEWEDDFTGDKTELFFNTEDTEILFEDSIHSQARAFLEVNRNKEIEKIEITGDRFVIGRNLSAVNYLDETKGISRIHLEIIYNPEGFQARDLGSKNGSFLNGQKLVPNELYVLTDQDVLRLAKTEYTFKTG
ncbi:FHA domain-containing protein [Candidatus Contubernalis alkaliaceticus]|uniref:FHA domain-containing protein n=1 Tax=Candidatus Contubernalis alkaliaceticus TaxID=338645 RepID=UPI001F4C2BDD|nr:FHA domain-containing protein [Candidatus Contubernalis alkalaceticus]UNC91134.1 FHA domain-containing protein [Candidatus Contubernalis alkalaceticus]